MSESDLEWLLRRGNKPAPPPPVWEFRQLACQPGEGPLAIHQNYLQAGKQLLDLPQLGVLPKILGGTGFFGNPPGYLQVVPESGRGRHEASWVQEWDLDGPWPGRRYRAHFEIRRCFPLTNDRLLLQDTFGRGHMLDWPSRQLVWSCPSLHSWLPSSQRLHWGDGQRDWLTDPDHPQSRLAVPDELFEVIELSPQRLLGLGPERWLVLDSQSGEVLAPLNSLRHRMPWFCLGASGFLVNEHTILHFDCNGHSLPDWPGQKVLASRDDWLVTAEAANWTLWQASTGLRLGSQAASPAFLARAQGALGEGGRYLALQSQSSLQLWSLQRPPEPGPELLEALQVVRPTRLNQVWSFPQLRPRLSELGCRPRRGLPEISICLASCGNWEELLTYDPARVLPHLAQEPPLLAALARQTLPPEWQVQLLFQLVSSPEPQLAAQALLEQSPQEVWRPLLHWLAGTPFGELGSSLLRLPPQIRQRLPASLQPATRPRSEPDVLAEIPVQGGHCLAPGGADYFLEYSRELEGRLFWRGKVRRLVAERATFSPGGRYFARLHQGRLEAYLDPAESPAWSQPVEGIRILCEVMVADEEKILLLSQEFVRLFRWSDGAVLWSRTPGTFFNAKSCLGKDTLTIGELHLNWREDRLLQPAPEEGRLAAAGHGVLALSPQDAGIVRQDGALWGLGRLWQAPFSLEQAEFSRDGSWLAASNRYGQVALWQLDQPQYPLLFEAPEVPHKNTRAGFLLNPEYRLLGFAGWLWHTGSGDCLVEPQAEPLKDWSFCPRRRRLVCLSEDTLNVYEFPS